MILTSAWDLLFTGLVEGILFFSLGAVALAQSRWGRWRERRDRPLLSKAQANLNLVLSGQACPDPLIDLPPEQQIEVLINLATGLGGSSLEQIRELARQLGHLGRAQVCLGDRRWWIRLKGARLLSSLGEAPTDLAHLLRDPHPLVRAEAIQMVGRESASELVEQVVRELFAPPSLARFSSQSAVPRLGGIAAEGLVRLLGDPPGPVSTALRTAAAVAVPQMLPAALHFSRSLNPEERAAATYLLSSIGSQEGSSRLLEMLDDEVRAQAAAALGHLGYWQAGPQLARLLKDPDWEVRHQAGLALRRLGPPGELFLRQASTGAAPEAAAMARYALGQPR